MPSSIATRTGDDGTTGLIFGQRVSKNHARVEAVGRFDELNAALGLAKATAAADRAHHSPSAATLVETLEAIQRDLVPIMGELSADDADQERYLASRFGALEDSALDRLDAGVRTLETGDPPLRFDGWATPGKTLTAAALDLARVAARRAERHLVAMREDGRPVRALLLRYVNRASDLLWLLARQAEQT
jgi:cob(I)alamin adenosyltransferase